MIRTALYAARTVAMIPVISVAFLLCLPFLVVRAVVRRPTTTELVLLPHDSRNPAPAAANNRRSIKRVL